MLLKKGPTCSEHLMYNLLIYSELPGKHDNVLLMGYFNQAQSQSKRQTLKPFPNPHIKGGVRKVSLSSTSPSLKFSLVPFALKSQCVYSPFCSLYIS